MKKLLSYVVLLALLSSSLYSCQHDKEAADDSTTIEDHSSAQTTTDELTLLTSEAVSVTEGSKPASGTFFYASCVTITHTSAEKKITIDFGTGCTGIDGRLRKGKINITYTGPYRTAGSVITTIPENFYIDGHKLEGTKTVTNVTTTSTKPAFNIKVEGGKITYADGTSIHFTSNRTREWTTGSQTMNLEDDGYLITGTWSGKNRSGRSFTASIASDNPLFIKLTCLFSKPITRHPVQGILTIKPEGLKERVIDYGQGTCDNEATLTIGRFTKTITLR